MREGRRFWVEEIPPAGQQGRTRANHQYFETMQRAKIVVTIGPNSNEGDFRFWEALMSGALVVSDRLHTPLPVPLLDREDVVFLDFFDPKKVGHDDRSFRDLDEVLAFYLSSPEGRLKVASSGYQKAVDHHRWVSRAQYMVDVFRSTPVPA